MGCVVVLAYLSVLLCALPPATHALGFRCSSQPEATCQALVGYKSPNTTTLRSIQSLFGVKHLRSLLAANNHGPGTPATFTVQANETVVIPFTCRFRPQTKRKLVMIESSRVESRRSFIISCVRSGSLCFFTLRKH